MINHGKGSSSLQEVQEESSSARTPAYRSQVVSPQEGHDKLRSGSGDEEISQRQETQEGRETMKKQKYPPEVVTLIRAAMKMPSSEAVLEPCASDGTCVCGIKKCDIIELQKALKGVGAKAKRPWKAGFMGMKVPA